MEKEDGLAGIFVDGEPLGHYIERVEADQDNKDYNEESGRFRRCLLKRVHKNNGEKPVTNGALTTKTYTKEEINFMSSLDNPNTTIREKIFNFIMSKLGSFISLHDVVGNLPDLKRSSISADFHWITGILVLMNAGETGRGRIPQKKQSCLLFRATRLVKYEEFLPVSAEAMKLKRKKFNPFSVVPPVPSSDSNPICEGIESDPVVKFDPKPKDQTSPQLSIPTSPIISFDAKAGTVTITGTWNQMKDIIELIMGRV